MTSRRSFLGAMLAAAMAPAIVKASNLMPIYVPKGLILFGDGIHDDTLALQTLISGGLVMNAVGQKLMEHNGVLRIPSGTFRLSNTLELTRSNIELRDSSIIYTRKLDALISVQTGVNDCVISGVNFQGWKP